MFESKTELRQSIKRLEDRMRDLKIQHAKELLALKAEVKQLREEAERAAHFKENAELLRRRKNYETALDIENKYKYSNGNES